MYDVDSILAILDFAVDTKRKRHILGGMLLSLSLLCGGLAVTALTTKEEQ